jgi:NAD(P) transhydrogenase
MEPLAPPEFFPYGIYSVPEISTTGLTEEEVPNKGIPYQVGVARLIRLTADTNARGHE